MKDEPWPYGILGKILAARLLRKHGRSCHLCHLLRLRAATVRFATNSGVSISKRPSKCQHMGVSVPQNGSVKIMENPVKRDDLGGKKPYFRKHPHFVRRDVISTALRCEYNEESEGSTHLTSPLAHELSWDIFAWSMPRGMQMCQHPIPEIFGKNDAKSTICIPKATVQGLLPTRQVRENASNAAIDVTAQAPQGLWKPAKTDVKCLYWWKNGRRKCIDWIPRAFSQTSEYSIAPLGFRLINLGLAFLATDSWSQQIFHDALGKGKRLTARFSPWVSMMGWKTILSFWFWALFSRANCEKLPKKCHFTPFVVDGFRTPTVNSPVEGWGLMKSHDLRQLWDTIQKSKGCLSTGDVWTIFRLPDLRTDLLPDLGRSRKFCWAIYIDWFATKKIQVKIYLSPGSQPPF